MSSNTNKEALRIFLNNDRGEIARDLEHATDRLKEIATRIKEYLDIPIDERTPEKIAENWHDSLLFAVSITNSGNVHEDEVLFQVIHTVEEVASEACSDAWESPGRLQELSKMMEDIEKREGLNKDEYWKKGEGPEDYEELTEKSEELFNKIREVCISYILKQYGFKSFLRLMETNMMEFEVRFEAGRRSIFSNRSNKVDSEVTYAGEKILMGKYGQQAVDLLYQRIAEIEEYKGR